MWISLAWKHKILVSQEVLLPHDSDWEWITVITVRGDFLLFSTLWELLLRTTTSSLVKSNGGKEGKHKAKCYLSITAIIRWKNRVVNLKNTAYVGSFLQKQSLKIWKGSRCYEILSCQMKRSYILTLVVARHSNSMKTMTRKSRRHLQTYCNKKQWNELSWTILSWNEMNLK